MKGKRKIGLVLAGGGGKGAYQIGVWKAFKEFGVDNNISAIAGTSIGALNGALMMQNSYEVADEIWSNISNDQIMTVDTRNIAAKFAGLGLNMISSALLTVMQHGWFSRKGLMDIINRNINLKHISNSEIQGFAGCFNLEQKEIEYLQLNGCADEGIKKILLATSAIPVLFGKENIDGIDYIDGGLPLKGFDNVPIKPLYDNGCNTIFVIHLSRDYIIDCDSFPNADIYQICPQESLGGVINGTLDFSKLGAKRRMEQGYGDALRILKPIYDMALTQAKIQKTMNQMKNDELEFKKKREVLLNERMEMKDELIKLIY